MPLQYNPKDAAGCWPEADYDAELIQVVDKVSKSSGNDMQEWKVKVHRGDGATKLISDYFVPPGSTFKLKQLAGALNKMDDFNAGTFQADDYEGAGFKVHLTIEAGEGSYEDKNKIQKYLSAESSPAPRPAPSIKQQIASRRQPVTADQALSSEPQFKKDDIPF